MEVRSKLCLICSLNCSGTSRDLNKLRENPNFREFLTALGEENKDGLNNSLINLLGDGGVNCGFTVCKNCKELIWEAMEWKGRVVEVESKVVKLQREILEELGRLEEFLGEYGGKLRRIRENVRMEVVQLRFDDNDGGDQEENEDYMEGITGEDYYMEGISMEDDMEGRVVEEDMKAIVGEEHKRILRGMGKKMDGVVADLDKFQDNLSSKIDEKRIQRQLKKSRKKFKSVQFLDSDSDDDDIAINQDKPLKKAPINHDNNDDDDWRPDSSDETGGPSTNPIKKSTKPSNQKRLGKYSFKNQVTRLILNRAKRFASPNLPNSGCSSIDIKYPLHYDPTLDKITIASTTQILIIKDKCHINHLQCTLCDYQTPNFSKQKKPSYSSVESIYDHVIKNHYGGFICEICGKVGSSRKKFLEHMLIHKEPEKYTCEICGRPCQTSESIKTHRFTHFNEEEKRREVEAGRATWWEKGKEGGDKGEGTFICETCGKSFGNLRYLKKHERIHDNVVMCPKCGKSVTKNWYRKYHSVYKCPLDGGEGLGRGEGKRKCWQCDKRFKDLITLKKHMKRIHSKEGMERSWICDKCGRGYKAKDDLKTHQKTHAEGMEWRCGDCGREFNQKKNYKRHNCAARKNGEGGNEVKSDLILGM